MQLEAKQALHEQIEQKSQFSYLNDFGDRQLEETLHHGNFQPQHSVLQPGDVSVAITVDGKSNLNE